MTVLIRNWWCSNCKEQRASDDLGSPLSGKPTCLICKTVCTREDFLVELPQIPSVKSGMGEFTTLDK